MFKPYTQTGIKHRFLILGGQTFGLPLLNYFVTNKLSNALLKVLLGRIAAKVNAVSGW